MKSFIFSLILLCVSHHSYAQIEVLDVSVDSNTITTTKRITYYVNPKYFKPIRYETNLSSSGYLYCDLENFLILEVSGFEHRNLFIEHDYDSNQLVTSEKWTCRYTLKTATDSGAYNENEINNSRKYVDTNRIYWKRRLSLTPKESQDFMLDVYAETDTNYILIGSMTLSTKPYPKPIYNFCFPNDSATTKDILNLDSLNVINNNDFRWQKEWFGISEYSLSIYNERNLLIYRRHIKSSLFPPEAKKQIRKLKKGGLIKINHVKTQKMIETNYSIHLK